MSCHTAIDPFVPAVTSSPEVDDDRLIDGFGNVTATWRQLVKLVRLAKRVVPVKSLKKYAWYGWI